MPDAPVESPVYQRERAEMMARLRRCYQFRDERTQRAMATTPRHLFVPEALRSNAYGDHSLPIDGGQTISQPLTVALQTELLEITGSDRVLEIGAGSGYQTAILAQVAGQVFALERLASLARNADRLIRALGYRNATIRCFDGTYGWSEFAPYRGILVAAAAPEIPHLLLDQLEIGGRLVIPVGGERSQRLLRVTRTGEGTVTEDFGDCQFVKLVGKFGWEK
ncbi:MAG: protein-L-isoaspartate(D-aspartate) O-methyltransferase [Blastocatellia bacterium]|jgi:protein-L-isoaspartate(D-aspartate) O-methyltransferase